MPYKVELESKTRIEFLALPKEVMQALLPIFDDLRDKPWPPGAKKLAGVDGYRIRRGEFHILYSVNKEKGVVRVFKITRRWKVCSKAREHLCRICVGKPPASAG